MSFLHTLQRFLFVPSREFSTTAAIHYKLKEGNVWNIWAWKPFATLLYALPQLRSPRTVLDVNERIIEVPWVISQLDFQKKGAVLDVGWLESTLPISLATAGFSVTGVDIRESELQHPNLQQIVGDICSVDLPDTQFEYVILLSTLEHIGLDTMYGKSGEQTSDAAAVERCLQLLKPGGTLIITTPVTQEAYVNNFMRAYTPKQLRSLLSSAKKLEMQFYAPNKTRTLWKKVSEEQLPKKGSFGVALIRARA